MLKKRHYKLRMFFPEKIDGILMLYQTPGHSFLSLEQLPLHHSGYVIYQYSYRARARCFKDMCPCHYQCQLELNRVLIFYRFYLFTMTQSLLDFHQLVIMLTCLRHGAT